MGCWPELAWGNALDKKGRMYFFFSKVGWIFCFSSSRTRPGGGEETLPGKCEGVLWRQPEWLAPCLPGPENCSSVWDGICSEACNGGTVQLGVPSGNSATGKEEKVCLEMALSCQSSVSSNAAWFWGTCHRGRSVWVATPVCCLFVKAERLHLLGDNGSCKEQLLPCPVAG